MRMSFPSSGRRSTKLSVSESSVPTARMTSASARKACTSGRTVEAESESGWSSGTMPLPAVEATTTAPRRPVISVRSAAASAAPPT